MFYECEKQFEVGLEKDATTTERVYYDRRSFECRGTTVSSTCNNVDEIYYEDYLVNNDGVGQFSILEDNLTAGTLDTEKYTPDLDDAGSSFKIVHLLPHPVAPNCIGTAILEFHVIDCVPEPDCPADEYLGIDIQEEENEDPDDPQWGEMLTISRTGSYEDPDVIDTDEIYYSYDDGGATWVQGTEVKDDDYYVKMTSGFTTTCSGGAQTGSQRVIECYSFGWQQRG